MIRELTAVDIPEMIQLVRGLDEVHPTVYESIRKDLQMRFLKLPAWKAWGEFGDDGSLLTWVHFKQFGEPMNRCVYWQAAHTLGEKPGALFDVMEVARNYYEFIHCFTVYTMRTPGSTPFCKVEGSPYYDYEIEPVELVKAGTKSVDPFLAKYMTRYTRHQDFEIVKMVKGGVDANPNVSA